MIRKWFSTVMLGAQSIDTERASLYSGKKKMSSGNSLETNLIYSQQAITCFCFTGIQIRIQVSTVLKKTFTHESTLILYLQTYIFMFKNIATSVPGSIVIGVVCIVILLALKYLDAKVKEKIKFPIPAELICVSIKYRFLHI